MRLFSTCAFICIIATVLFFGSITRCDDAEQKDAAAATDDDPNVAVAEDGTCDKEGCDGETEQDRAVKYTEEEEDGKETVAKEDEDGTKDEKAQGATEETDKTDKAVDDPPSCVDGICTGIEEKSEVDVEYLFKPETCGRRSPTNNDDVVTVHLRGYKASDMSEFITS